MNKNDQKGLNLCVSGKKSSYQMKLNTINWRLSQYVIRLLSLVRFFCFLLYLFFSLNKLLNQTSLWGNIRAMHYEMTLKLHSPWSPTAMYFTCIRMFDDVLLNALHIFIDILYLFEKHSLDLVRYILSEALELNVLKN